MSQLGTAERQEAGRWSSNRVQKGQGCCEDEDERCSPARAEWQVVASRAASVKKPKGMWRAARHRLTALAEAIADDPMEPAPPTWRGRDPGVRGKRCITRVL